MEGEMDGSVTSMSMKKTEPVLRRGNSRKLGNFEVDR